jgi:hypothetical protein
VLFLFFNYHFFSKGGDWLRELVGEGQEVLFFTTRLLKTTSGLMVGLD